MQETLKQLNTLARQIAAAMDKLQLTRRRQELDELEAQMASPDFWQDPLAAGELSARASAIKKLLAPWDSLAARVKDALELAQINDAKLADELTQTTSKLQAEYAAKEFELKLSGPHDASGAILTVHAGTGGTDAQDWAQMLQRMYLRYAQNRDWQATVLAESPGEEAGIKSTTIEVSGPYAYGRLKGEKGVHRLVRLSPYNSDNLRQTSFALVEVIPQIERPEEVEIDPGDLRVDVFRSGGHGGQSVNTTDSAVRLTHIPTGIVVSIQNERSQLQNKIKAMAILQSKLQTLMEEQHQQEVGQLKGPSAEAAWGHQIRSYVLHPYTKVKDHRTGTETSQAQTVLEGELDQFVEAYLHQAITG